MEFLKENNVIKILLVTFIVSLLLVPIAKKIANHVGALDMPNERKIHTKPMPRLGGLAIYSSFLFGYVLFGEPNIQMISILISSFIIIIVGIIDDIKPVKARYKFLVQLIAAAIVVIYGQIYFTEITFLGLKLSFNLTISYLLSIIFVVSISNAINLIDGLDGLASGVSAIYFATITIIALLLERTMGLDFTLSIIMLGATLGFLFHNFPPAKIFMGDSGSLFLGFMISVISLVSFKIATLTSLVIPVTILSIPIFDTALAIFRRLLKGENIGTPDKEHFHHQLLKLKFSPRVSVIIIYMINILFAIISIFYAVGNTKESVIIYGIMIILLLFVIFGTDILYVHNRKSRKK